MKNENKLSPNEVKWQRAHYLENILVEARNDNVLRNPFKSAVVLGELGDAESFYREAMRQAEALPKFIRDFAAAHDGIEIPTLTK